ncbi:MAG TPA: GNAT family N-acetyltransferase [Chloroflexi bacterium]|jgi:ribosomal-protein-alanine N-acetyltransferase|nr:GNAT family N-acetyltransferase [Chloroflexota bacterium]
MDTSRFSIVPATWRDLTALRRLENECFREDAWPVLDLIGALTLPNMVRLKAINNENGEMIGFICGDPDTRQQVGWITTVCVDPAYRRQGIGTALLDECERQLRLPRIRLSVARSNHGALRLYEQRGYRKVDVWRQYYRSGDDALVLEKNSLTIP